MNIDSELLDLQKAQLCVYRKFKEICNKYNLRYFAIGGTCLGAVRHRGFIPWDDDMDVAMPYEDFTKFKKIIRRKKFDGYAILDSNMVKHQEGNVLKFYDARTTMIENYVVDYPDRFLGVSIDVFPVYGMTNNKVIRSMLLMLNEILDIFNIAIRYPAKSFHTLKGKIVGTILSPLKLILPFNFFSRCRERVLKNFSFDETKYVFFAWRKFHARESDIYNYKQLFPHSAFAETIELPFEDTTMPVPKGYDTYLRMDFGDYMTLPPESEQRAKHSVAVFDLERPYTYYQNKDIRQFINNKEKEEST